LMTEQVYNPDDGSFSLLHFSVDWGDSTYFVEGLKSTWDVKSGYLLPIYNGVKPEYVAQRNSRPQLGYLWKAGYLEADGNTPKIKSLITQWLTSGHVPEELEKIPLLPHTKSFKKN